MVTGYKTYNTANPEKKLELERRNADYKVSHIRWQRIFDFLSGQSNEK
jgi:hypothetical protein